MANLNSVSHDLPEIIVIYWFGAQETFLMIIYVENRFCVYICAETMHG